MKDLRNALARARDEFLESDQGKRICEGSASGPYLRNRIEAAFIAGWIAAEKHEGYEPGKYKP